MVAPKSTEANVAWGSYGITRGTVNTTNGLANTDTLASRGSSVTTGHPSAYTAKNLTTGGYNTWYMPAIQELITLYSNQSKTPFASANGFLSSTRYWSSTEVDANNAINLAWWTGAQSNSLKYNPMYSRAVRRSTI